MIVLVSASMVISETPVTVSAGSSHAELSVQVASDQFSILEVDESGLVGSPDGHVTFLREADRLRFWAPINGGTVELATTDFLDARAMTDPPVEVLEPSASSDAFDSEYAGGSKVIRLPDGRLAMIYHGEHHPCSGDKAEVTIGLATSSDNGTTWDRQGAIISAPPWNFGSCDERNFYGAGSFSAVVAPDRQYVYVYFNQWTPDETAITKVARARIADGLGPGTWFKYHHGRWREPGLGGLADDVLPVPDTPMDQEWRSVAIPSVSWNTEYRMWLAVFVTVTGFWYSSSLDGLHWVRPRMLLDDVVLFSPRSMIDHQPYIYYPSLIDPLAQEDGRTARDGLLIYAQGGWTAAHHMVGRNVRITKENVPGLPVTGSETNLLPVLALIATGMGFALFDLRRRRDVGTSRPSW